MKKISICSALFALLLFVISCDDGSKNDDKKEIPDSGETVTDTEQPDGEQTDTASEDDSDKTDTSDSGNDSDNQDVKTPCNPNPCESVSSSNGECIEKGETFECGCSANYTWKDGGCVADTQKASCTTLPENAAWNTAAEITQTWSGSAWEPSTIGVYNEEASTSECRFKCVSNEYEWDGAKCVLLIPPCNAENAGKTCKDYETGYIWSAQSAEKYAQEDSEPYCEGLDTDGLSWKLPDIDELRTIIRNCDKTKTGGSCPVSVDHFDNDTYCKPYDDCKGCIPEEGIEYNIFGIKKGDDYVKLWSSTQAQENTYLYYTIMFSSYSRMAYIAPDYTSSWNIRCLGSSKCPEHYELDGNFECVPATRKIMCSDLPEDAIGDPLLNHTITQTWDIESGMWLPENTKYHLCDEYNPYECCFRCPSAFVYNESSNKCEQAGRTQKCTGLPDDAEWNGTDQVSQLQYPDGSWWPSDEGFYATAPGSNECHFKCKNGFWWTGIKCESTTKKSACTGLPANAEWNTVSEITQTRTDSGWWSPSTVGVHDDTASTNECHFKCKSGYTWNGSGCGSTTRTTDCKGRPNNSEWNTVSQITQTKDTATGEWLPSTEVFYSETPSDKQCVFKCSEGYEPDTKDFENYNINYCTKESCGVLVYQNSVCKGATSGLMWAPIQSEKTMTIYEAFEYCQNMSWGGYHDWRLPTINELRTTVTSCPLTAGGGCGITDSCTDWDKCHRNCTQCGNNDKNILNTPGFVWSSTKGRAEASTGYATIYFQLYTENRPWILGEVPNDTGYVRCVR